MHTQRQTQMALFIIVLIKSIGITKMWGIISTGEDHNVISEALDVLGNDCSKTMIRFIVRMKVICWDINERNFGRKHKVLLTDNKTLEIKKPETSFGIRKAGVESEPSQKDLVKCGRKELNKQSKWRLWEIVTHVYKQGDS